MTANPSPRRALRKAPDATVHPAAPVASQGASVTQVVVKPSKLPRQPVAELRPVLGIGGSTSDVLRKAPKRSAAGKKAGVDKAGTKKGQTRKTESPTKAKKGQRKRHERRVDLRVKVPKEVRQELRRNAKARGTSVDDVVTVVLEGWIDG